VLRGLGGGQRQRLWWSKPWLLKWTSGTWNIPSLVGNEPRLPREVERYWIDLIELTSKPSKGSGNNLPERGWTLFISGAALGERR